MVDETKDAWILPIGRLAELFEALSATGHHVVGPKLENGVIGYAELRGAEELPVGWTDEQSPGRYRAVRRNDDGVFGYAAGQRSFRQLFQVSETKLVALRRNAGGPALVVQQHEQARPLALLGARACDLRAIAIQDRVLAGGAYRDPHYAARRASAVVVAVNCTEPSATCFCTSMNAGPRAESGYDVSLTELVEPPHRFVVYAGSERGRRLVDELGLERADPAARALEASLVESARGRMGRTLEEEGVREALLENLEHPAWDAVAERCLACTNCTLVCPTCFCTTTVDRVDPTGEHAERLSRHDSCFSLEYSHLHGGSARSSIKSRYRQWLTHKFATWYDQFGSSGCVGCGRCITFCPVGIDVTEEIAKIREPSHAT